MSSLADSLLKQAGHLATVDQAGAPNQANLRRAISAAYYSLFRLLVDGAADRLAGKGSEPAYLLSRAFSHSGMKQACKAFAAGTLKTAVATHIPSLSIPQDLRLVCRVFVDLQQKRHQADYDRSLKLTRQGTLTEIKRAQLAFDSYKQLRKLKSSNPDKKALEAFQVCLLVYDTVRS